MAANAERAQRLMSAFVTELDEHARAMERDVLALERAEGAPAAQYASLFRSAHSLKGAARVIGLETVETVCHHLEEIVAALREGRLIPDPALFQLLLSTADFLRGAGRLLAEKRQADGLLRPLLPKLAAALDGVLPAADREPVPAAPARPAPAPAPARAGKEHDPTLRVQAGKLDALLAQDGELLIARRRHAVHSEDLDRLQRQLAEFVRAGDAPPALREISRGLQGLAGRIAGDLKALDRAAAQLSMEIRQARLVPFKQGCEGLDRLVRDLTVGGDKEAILRMTGGDLGIDRSILEGLRDPLTHLVRNAVDHGIEPRHRRVAAGKPPAGTIAISVTLTAAQIVVTVADDGRGIDAAVIGEQAQKRGFAPSPAAQAHNVIFEPGFSTSESISRISGRGIGLDVVKTGIEAMRGAVRVTTEAGKGTQFTMVLPLTLTAIRAVLLGCAGQTFALDSTVVRGLVRVGRDELRVVEGRPVLVGQGERPVPLARLSSLLGMEEARPACDDGLLAVALLGAGAPEAAIAVDAFFDEDMLTVRNLGHRFGRVPNVSGGTILPDGRVALILHAGDLIAGTLNGAGRTDFVHKASAAPARKRLVIAEDSLTTRTMMKAILENAGYDVAAAADGAQAWRILEENAADLVVADIEMPEMDGFRLTEALRESARHAEIPIILLTALESDRDKARGLAAGANAYLRKSTFDQRELLAVIAQMV